MTDFIPDPSRLRTPCACGRTGRYGGNRAIGLITHVLFAHHAEPRYACPTCAEEAGLGTLIRTLQPGYEWDPSKRRYLRRLERRALPATGPFSIHGSHEYRP